MTLAITDIDPSTLTPEEAIQAWAHAKIVAHDAQQLADQLRDVVVANAEATGQTRGTWTSSPGQVVLVPRAAWPTTPSPYKAPGQFAQLTRWLKSHHPNMIVDAPDTQWTQKLGCKLAGTRVVTADGELVEGADIYERPAHLRLSDRA